VRRIFVILGLLGSTAPSAGSSLAITAARAIDPASGAVTEPAIILIENGRIKSVGSKTEVPAGVEVVAVPSGTVVPGYFDAHTHLAATQQPQWDGVDFYFMALNHPTALRALEGAAHARQMLDSGFTSVRDVGNGGDHVDLELARAIKWGLIPGPTMFASGRIISPFGGQFMARVSPQQLQTSEYFFADSHDEMRRAVRENAYYGADLIKVVVDATASPYSAEDLRFLVEEAGRAKLKVAAHCQTLAGTKAAVEAGVFSIEHAFQVDRSTLQRMKENGIYLVATPFTVEALESLGWSPREAIEKHKAHVSRVREAASVGVVQAFGTDLMTDVAKKDRGQAALGYIGSYLEAGLSPMEVLKVLTINGARVTGTDSFRGKLASGAAADLLVLDGDPRADPNALARVKVVVKDGRIVRR
jgi:imidazolonepropionase-like amidohydrolase